MEENIQAVAGQETTPTPAPEKLDIAKIVEDLKAQGLESEKIVEALKAMLAEGKITEEELAEGLRLAEGVEKEEAGKLFGVDIL